MRFLLMLPIVLWLCIAATAQTKIAFTQKAICKADGRIDIGKFMELAAAEVKLGKALNGTRVDNDQLFQLIVDSDPGQTFSEDYVAKENKYFIFYSNDRERRRPTGLLELLRNPSAYVWKCRDFPPKEGTPKGVREVLDDAQKAVGKNLLVGKDLDSLSKDLSTREPARISVTRDGLKNNTLLQTEFAVAGYFRNQIAFPAPNDETDLATLIVMPFFTGSGSYNSQDKLKDVDKATSGIMVDFWSIPILGTYHGLSARAGYQIDTSLNYEALVTELVYYPPSGLLGLVELGQKSYPAGEEGPWVIFELSPRLRYGSIYENLSVPTLPSSGDFLRAGYKVAASVGFSGDDFLSKFGFNFSYLYYDNLRGDHGISQFEKIDAALTYKFTETYGISLIYRKGRDEDQLKAIEQIIGALTFKFGEKPGSGK